MSDTPATLQAPGRDWSTSAVHVLAKPTGAICNLACAYCFYLDKEHLYDGDRFRMSDETLDTYITSLVEAHTEPEIPIAWQGGEPTLMGVDFFRRAMEIEHRFQEKGVTFRNSIQTNGTLLTDEWCDLFGEHEFLVGISIDGPRDLHDAHRVDKRGEGSFDKVMRGLRLLQKHDIDHNILTTVNRVNGDHPREVYRFLRDDAGADWMQFIPVVERVSADGAVGPLNGSLVSDRSVRPEQLGEFLCGIFDEWVQGDVGEVFVQTFESALASWLGLASCGICVFDQTCGHGLALEHNGDLYSCDHFVDPEHLLGNITESTISALAGQETQQRFGYDKLDSLPAECRKCDVRFACNGGCPKNRFTETSSGEAGLNYLCAGYKRFFHHIDPPMRAMMDLVNNGRPASGVMAEMACEERRFRDEARRAGRNGPCPCGSGLKTKNCHGRRAPATGCRGTLPAG